MTEQAPYTTQLQAGLGLIDETRQLLQLWEPGMSASLLYDSALHSGQFGSMSARRLTNIVKECFAPRYLSQKGLPARLLKAVLPLLPSFSIEQLFLLYTMRATPVLADFIREIYWPKYVQGYLSISNEDARQFVTKANQIGKTQQSWSDTTIRRVSSYLTGACADFRLLESGTKSVRKILSFRIQPTTLAWLAYDLHFQGLGDNAVIHHPDWQIFGLHPEDVRQELRRLSLKGFFIIQTTADSTHMSWNYNNWEQLIHGLTE
jgi:hypothetical protein